MGDEGLHPHKDRIRRRRVARAHDIESEAVRVQALGARDVLARGAQPLDRVLRRDVDLGDRGHRPRVAANAAASFSRSSFSFTRSSVRASFHVTPEPRTSDAAAATGIIAILARIRGGDVSHTQDARWQRIRGDDDGQLAEHESEILWRMELGLGVSVETDAPVADAPPRSRPLRRPMTRPPIPPPAVEAAAAKPKRDSPRSLAPSEARRPGVRGRSQESHVDGRRAHVHGGFDPTAPDELQKAKQRMSRFGTAEQIEQSKEDEADEARQKRAARFGVTVPIATTGGRAMHALGLSVATRCSRE